MRDVILGLDLGTTGVKVLALDRGERVVAEARANVRVDTPEPGHVTQDPEAYWRAVLRALRRVARRVEPGRLRALALSGAMHSLMPVRRDGTPLAPAMTWADGRGVGEAAQIRREIDAAACHRRTGCPVTWLYHPARLRWWLTRGPKLPSDVLFASLKDLVSFRLTGNWACDAGLASCAGLLDLRRRAWDDEALRVAGVERAQLPALVQPHDQAGVVSRAGARRTGLPEGLPVIAGSSDGCLANLGAAGGAPGRVVLTAGTSGAVRVIDDEPRVDEAGRTWCYLLAEGLYVRGGAINNGGLSVQWVAERFYARVPKRKRFDVLMEEAAAVPIGADGVTALPYFTGERSPHWDPTLRATLHGLRLSHGRAHAARAVLEGVAYCLADVWRDLNVCPREAFLTGGITRSPQWARIVADVLGVPLRLAEAADASAVGAVRLARWALGEVDNLGAFAPEREGAKVEPSTRRGAYASPYARFGALQARVPSTPVGNA